MPELVSSELEGAFGNVFFLFSLGLSKAHVPVNTLIRKRIKKAATAKPTALFGFWVKASTLMKAMSAPPKPRNNEPPIRFMMVSLKS
jgi:hypothetical protein